MKFQIRTHGTLSIISHAKTYSFTSFPDQKGSKKSFDPYTYVIRPCRIFLINKPILRPTAENNKMTETKRLYSPTMGLIKLIFIALSFSCKILICRTTLIRVRRLTRFQSNNHVIIETQISLNFNIKLFL